MKHLLSTLMLFISLTTFAQTDRKLTAQLQTAVKGFNGQVGIYVHNLKTGKTVEINADSLFPTASMIKVSILSGLMDRLRKAKCSTTKSLFTAIRFYTRV